MSNRLMMGIAVALVAAACGGDGEAATTTAEQPTTTAPAVATTAPTTTTTTVPEPTTTTTVPDPTLAQRAAAETSLPPGDAYTEWETVTSGVLRVSVPAAWDDVDARDWRWTGKVTEGRYINAATNVRAWNDAWGTPGMFLGVTAGVDPVEVGMLDLDWMEPGECSGVTRLDYDGERYNGVWDVYDDCEGNGYVVFALYDNGDDHVLYLALVAVTQADLEVLDVILESVQVLFAG